MQTQRIPLREDNPEVFLDTYLLYDSPEFQSGRARPAVIVCPGGAYLFTSDREAEPVALRFLAQGYHAFVLRYSVRTRFPQPMLDLAKAILTIRAHAAEWHVAPDQIAVCGFSAGGHLASAIGVLWNDPLLLEPLDAQPEQIRPNALILGYPLTDLERMNDRPTTLEPGGPEVSLKETNLTFVLGDPQPAQELLDRYHNDLHVSAETPPTFIWHTAADELVPALNSLRFATALAEHGVPYELHIFGTGIHGLALADETTDVNGKFINPASQVWVDLALKWLTLVLDGGRDREGATFPVS